jgi:hypothetical protein
LSQVPPLGRVGTHQFRNGVNCQQIKAAGYQEWAKFHFHSGSRYLHSKKSCSNNAFSIRKVSSTRYSAPGDSLRSATPIKKQWQKNNNEYLKEYQKQRRKKQKKVEEQNFIIYNPETPKAD